MSRRSRSECDTSVDGGEAAAGRRRRGECVARYRVKRVESGRRSGAQNVVGHVRGPNRSVCKAVVEEEKQKVTRFVQVPEFSGCGAATVAGLKG